MNVAARSGPALAPSAVSYREALAWLYSLQRFGIKLGLENIQRLIAELGLTTSGEYQIAADHLPKTSSPRTIFHVAGTNGKGSVCAMLEAICRAHGYRTGLFISPHLVSFRERIRVRGRKISEQEVADGLTSIRRLVADWDPHPTFFEVTTALALKHFAETKANMVILETGLGGRLDATNAVLSNVSVITPIDFDHEKWLGNSLAGIAAEKAGIIKPGTPVVTSLQAPEAERVIRARAAECEAPLQFVTEFYDKTPIGLRGTHQKQNAALALAALGAAGIEVSDAAIARGLLSVQWPARFQRWDERIIIDGAHNPAAARVLAQTWRENFAGQRATVIMAVLSDKNFPAMWEALVPIADNVILTATRGERARPPEELAEVIAKTSIPCSVVPSVKDAIQIARTRPSPILLTGSLHFAGEAIALLEGKPAAFEECAQ